MQKQNKILFVCLDGTSGGVSADPNAGFNHMLTRCWCVLVRLKSRQDSVLAVGSGARSLLWAPEPAQSRVWTTKQQSRVRASLQETQAVTMAIMSHLWVHELQVMSPGNLDYFNSRSIS